MERRIHTIVRDFADRVHHEYGANIQAIIVYGSAARDEMRKHSDVDVAIIMEDQPKGVWKRISEIVFQIVLETEVYISVQILSPEDLERTYNPYIQNLLNEGVAVV